MDIKTYVSNGYEIILENIALQEGRLLLAARKNDEIAMNKARQEIEKMEALKEYIEAMKRQFPELS